MSPYARRYADDEEMNDELREVERWNDPAANFLTVLHFLSPSLSTFSPTNSSIEIHRKEKRNLRNPNPNSHLTQVHHLLQTDSISNPVIDGTELIA